MADNSARIAEIKSVLQSGVRSSTVDGTSVSIDHESLRKELRKLEAEDDATRVKRPVAASVYLGGF